MSMEINNTYGSYTGSRAYSSSGKLTKEEAGAEKEAEASSSARKTVTDEFTDVDYSLFYKGTTDIASYGSGAYKKDTLVKYEFNTVGEDGSKLMDKMSKEETMKALNDISSQYGDNVIVQFSGDGLAALAQGGKFMSDKTMTAEEAAEREARDAAFQAEIVPLNAHRIVIPNTETNERLYNSLEGADDRVISSVTGIIGNYLMPSSVSGLSEEQRKDMAAFGLEAAKYLAKNYLDQSHASDFLSAMETIAKYGLNGTVEEDGRVVYNIRQGQVTMAGAPEGHVDMESWLKANDTELYNQIYELNQSIINHKDGESHADKFIELYTKATKEILGASDDTKTDSEYGAWKEAVEKTELPTAFRNVKYDDFKSFLVSLQNQSSLSDSWLSRNLNWFVKWLTD